jgi:hypothetical protein
MAEEERDPERMLRVKTMVNAIRRATEGQTLCEVHQAMGQAIALQCHGSNPEDPDIVFFELQAVLLEMYCAVRDHIQSGKSPQEILN